MWRGKFLDSSTLDLCNQLTADVLSLRAKKHDSSSNSLLDIESQTVIRADTNSKELFCFAQAMESSFHSLYCHACPKELKPPNPVGQASDQLITDGR
jgi:hypothetical protein